MDNGFVLAERLTALGANSKVFLESVLFFLAELA